MKNDIDARQAYIDGLHQIADFLAEHPEVPLPSIGSFASGAGRYEPTLQVYLNVYREDDQRTALAEVARAMGSADKVVSEELGRFSVVRRFAGIALVASADRAEVCERVVTGTREVTVEQPDPTALAAVPKVSVTKTVEDVEWVCTPLLKTSPTSLISVPSGADS